MLLRTLSEVNVKNKRVLIRTDLNVPMNGNIITSHARIQAALPGIRQAMSAGAKVILMSHLGRPKAGEFDPSFSLAPVAQALSEALGQEVPVVNDWQQGLSMQAGEVVLLENLRFLQGETSNDSALASQLAALCDVFVMDAFATAHRKHASTYGVAAAAPEVCAGALLAAELSALERALANPSRPLVAIVGGAKVSSKLKVLHSLVEQVDCLVLGGGIANTFLAAAGHNIGQSLYEADLVSEAQSILARARQRGVTIPLPTDVVTAKTFAVDAQGEQKTVAAIQEQDMILDFGAATVANVVTLLQGAKTILWNGPLGVFEFPAFAEGTKQLSEAVAKSAAFSIAGGGDTVAAVEQFGVADNISYISTGGGAFLDYLQQETLPGVAILQQRQQEMVS